jgi:hypothetical protein
MNEGSIACLLSAMQIIGEIGPKFSGTFLPDQKAVSLKVRWFQVKKEELVQQQGWTDAIGQNTSFFVAVGYSRVMSVYTKSYNKWRYEEHIDLKSKTKFFACVRRLVF